VAVQTKKDAGRFGNRILRGRCRMTMLYPIVLETEESGAVSAYVPGLPVYAAAHEPPLRVEARPSPSVGRYDTPLTRYATRP
jgi:hypothetical protein